MNTYILIPEKSLFEEKDFNFKLAKHIFVILRGFLRGPSLF
jgi:hypothetical protein